MDFKKIEENALKIRKRIESNPFLSSHMNETELKELFLHDFSLTAGICGYSKKKNSFLELFAYLFILMKVTGTDEMIPNVEGIKDWPPKPGFTDINKIMSTLSIT